MSHHNKSPTRGAFVFVHVRVAFFHSARTIAFGYITKDFRCEMTTWLLVRFVEREQSLPLPSTHHRCLYQQALVYYRKILHYRMMCIFLSAQILIALRCFMIHSVTIRLLSNRQRNTKIGGYKKPEGASLVFHLSGFCTLFHIFSRNL